MGKQRFALLLLAVFFSFYSFFFHLSHSHAETLHGTPQDDSIVSTGTYDGIISYEGDDTIVIESSSQIIGDSQQTSESSADADVTAIDSGSGDDQLTNNGSVSANADADALPKTETASTATSRATAINTGDGVDGVENAAIIEVTSTATATTDDMVFTAAGDNNVDVSASATAEATGISSEVGNLTTTNTNTITVEAEANAAAGKFTTQLVDKSSMDGGVTAEAIAIGIFGGDGDGNGGGLYDTIINEGSITTTSTAKADNSEFRNELMDWSVADTTALASGEAIGIKTGLKNSTVENNGIIKSSATTQSELWKAELNITDWGLGSSGLTVESKATGIEGNDGIDQISNTDLLEATATSGADKVTINFSFIDATFGPGFWEEILGDSAGSADTLSKATAVGISGESGDDTISNTGTINVSATSTLKGTAVSIGAEGIPSSIIDVLQGKSLASADPTAETSATGIRGGIGKDTITNEGVITTVANSTAEDISVILSLPLLEKLIDFPSPAFALGGAGISAISSATGIEGNEGDDIIDFKKGLVDVDATSTTTGKIFSIAAQGIIDNINIIDLQASVADTSLKSESTTSGIDGGEGNDTITVTGISILNVDATATATSTEVSAGVQGQIEEAFNVGASLVRADTTASAIASGIEGGEGDDTIDTAGTVTVTADPSATSTAVSAEVQLSVEKSASVSGAIADTSTKALATDVTGISGGGGGDSITNSGMLSTTASPEAKSTSIIVDFQNVDQGLVAGLTYVDSETRAEAKAVGIDGGEGQDSITNTATGQIEVNADPKSTSTSVGVTAEVGFTKEVNAIFGGSVTDGTTTAVSTAMGIDAGDEDDTVNNYGLIKVQANEEGGDPDADSTNVSATVTVSREGVTAGFSYADSETTAEATSIGIDTGSGDDTITNANINLVDGYSLDSSAYAVSSSDTVAVTVSGTWEGISLGVSLTDSSTVATAKTVGIDSGSGNDIVTSESGIRANAEAEASSTTVTVNGAVSIKGISAGAAVSDVKTNSEAVAAGIDCGAGNDEVTNESTVDVSANALTETDSITINISTVGAAISDASLTASSETVGIDGGLGIDTLKNKMDIIVESTSTVDNLGATVNFAGATRGDASIEAFAEAIGMRGDDTDDETASGDTLSNLEGGLLEVESHAKIYGNKYVAQGGGVLFAKSVATVDAEASGIAGGVGSDTLLNAGNIDVASDSVADVESMNFQLSGVALTKAGINADARATGIYGGNGSNEITNSNSGSIEVKAEVDTLAASMTADFGFGLDLTGVTGKAFATGIQSGDAEDTINNYGDISVTTRALGEAGNAAIGLAHLTNATSFTDAIMFGIDSGSSSDLIINTGSMLIGYVEPGSGPLARADTESVAMSLLGFSISSMGAKAYVAGISAGDGDDEVCNSGSLLVGDPINWMVEGESFGYAGQFIGLEIGVSSASSSVTASGIDGGKGNDVIINETINDIPGTIEVHARSYAYVDAEVNVSTFGDGGVEGKSVANTSATGISGGIGNDSIENNGMISVGAYGRAEGEATIWIGWGGPEAKMTAEVNADAFGIDAGNGSNTIINSGTIDVQSGGDTWSYSEADTDVSDNKSNATSDMTINATGIAAGDDNNAVTNSASGTIDVTARAGKPAIATVVKSYADEDSTASAIAQSSSAGISLGDGGNTVVNNGQITVTSEVIQKSHGLAKSIPSDSFSRSKTDASANATGVKVGDGDNIIINTEMLTVTAVNTGVALSEYTTAHLTNSLAYAGMEGTALTSDAMGIVVGNGVNLIENYKNIIVSSTVNATATAKANTTRDTNHAEAYAGGDAQAEGILVGNGQNKIYNYGNMTVSAVADAKAYGYGEDYGWAFVGDESSPGVIAEATGISVGQGINEIINSATGILEVNTTATAYSYAYADTYADDPHGKAIANSYAAATGIQAGDGGNTVTNYGTINVTANAGATAAWHVDSTWGDEYLDFYSSAESNATGIQTGFGNDNIVIGGEGELSVMATSNNFLALTDTIAIGVDGGDGDNFVENRGHIYVSADSKVTIGTADAAASGIQTGNGDDTIINSGTIETIEKTQVYILSMSSLGVGITSGGGNDQLFLMNGSVTNGHIDLGEGDDSLIFSGTPHVEGDLTGSAGIDTLVFDGPGSIGFTFSPVAFENAVKQGTGTFTVANLPTMQRIEVNQDTLQINNDYVMANDGTFQTYVNGDGTNGLLKVEGTAQLAGDLRVIKGPGPYINGTTYDIIQADVLNGVFDSETLPEAKPLLSFQTHTYSDRLEVEALAKSFTTVAANSLQRTIAQHLDNIIPKATGDLSLVLGDFQVLSESDFNEAFSSLSPDSYDNATRITFEIARLYAESVHQRMHSLRASLTSPSTVTQAKSNKDPILLAYNGSESSIGQILSETQRVEEQNRAGMWTTIFGQWGDQDEEDGYTGFDYSVGGLTFGLDYLLTDSLITGLSLGYADTKIDLDRDAGDGNIESLGGSIYGTYFNKHTYFETVLSYGDQSYDNNRNIVIGPLLRTAHSEHDGDVFSAYGAGGYSFQSKEWIIRPFGSMQYVYLDEDGFQESGAGSINLRVDGRKTESLVSNLGVRFARVFEFEGGRLVPEASLAWQYDFDIDDRNITTSFVGSPGNAFTIEGQDLENHSAKIGIGLTFINKRNFSVSLNYNAELRENYNSNGIIGYLRLTF